MGSKCRSSRCAPLLLGGVAFDVQPGAAQAPESTEDHVFPMFANKEAAQAASYSRKIPLLAYFPGSVGGLAPGADVTLRGI